MGGEASLENEKQLLSAPGSRGRYSNSFARFHGFTQIGITFGVINLPSHKLLNASEQRRSCRASHYESDVVFVIELEQSTHSFRYGKSSILAPLSTYLAGDLDDLELAHSSFL